MTPDDFNPTEIEAMQVEFEECDNCEGVGITWKGIEAHNCPKCHGCCVVPVEKEEEYA